MHHEGGPRRGLLADRVINRLSTTIIATCSNVSDCLENLEKVDPAKIKTLEYRLDIEGFGKVSDSRVAAIRSQYGLLPSQTVVGMITRFVWWKGVEFGVEAFTRYLATDPDAVLVIAKAVGPHGPVVWPLLDSLPEHSYRLVEHEDDIQALYGAFDILMHLPVSAGVEAWGQVYVEAMAAGIPMVCTRAGIGIDVLEDGVNCILVNYRDANSTYDGLVRLAADEHLQSSIVANGHRDVTRYMRTPDLNTLDFVYGFSTVQETDV
jgi:glycosyltransferase involved in cell wall biosynthesis